MRETEMNCLFTMKKGELPTTPPRVPSQIRSGVSLISHVGDTQVLEKRRYVDRELGGREREGEKEGRREGGRPTEEKETAAAESIALPCHPPSMQRQAGRQAGRCMLGATGSHSLRA